MGYDYLLSSVSPFLTQFRYISIFSDIAPVGKKAQGIMADGQADDDEDEGVPEEKRLADDVRSDAKVREGVIEMKI